MPFEFAGFDLERLSEDLGEHGVPHTRVTRVDLAEVVHAWRGAEAERTRAIHGADGRLVRTVDFDGARGYLLHSRPHGRFLISADGLQVRCAPLARASRSWTAMLIAQVLPLVATLRGFEVFHASAVVRNGHALLFCAPSGTGKTSLAVRLVLSGAGLLADDVVALRAAGAGLSAHPGAGVVRLPSDQRSRLALRERDRLGSASRQLGKWTYAVELERDPAPVGAFFMMRRVAGRASPGPLRRLDVVDPFTLLASTFNLSVRTPERLERQLDVCVRLARDVPIVEVDIAPRLHAAELATTVAEWAAATL